MALIPDYYRPLIGRDWIKQLSDEDRKVLARLGYEACLLEDIPLASLGGKARAKSAKRDAKGHFISTTDPIDIPLG